MKVVYICGPFTGPNAWEIEQNIRLAEEIGLVVARLGAMPLIPHANTRFFFGQCTPEFWYTGTMELLTRCDALITVGDWKHSVGSVNEVRWARKHLPGRVFHSTTALRQWIRGEGETS